MDTQNNVNPPEFIKFPKIPRFSRDIVITEKIDGTNAQIYIDPEIQLRYGTKVPFLCGSRNRWIFPDNDNYGFATWAYENADEILKLGVGRHFGEWWGLGIQRGYGLKEKKFSLFNVTRWCRWNASPREIKTNDPRIIKFQEVAPKCVDVVPVLYRGPFNHCCVDMAMSVLEEQGSYAAPGFKRPEGVVIFHTASGQLFKKTLENDEVHKWEV